MAHKSRDFKLRHSRPRPGARRSPAPRKNSRRTPRSGIRSWLPRLQAHLVGHARALLATLGILYRTPLVNMMTITVIGIAMALPTGLYVLLHNLQNVSSSWDGATQISLFTKLTVTNEQARALEQRLLLLPEIDSIHLLTREQALEEFRQLSGFGEALDALEENPLPAVLIIRPGLEYNRPETVHRLLEELQRQPETELAQLDMQWVKRLYTIMEIGQRGVLVIAALLALAVLLIVGNTIRLDILNRRDEIVITKLIGATNSFIRMPFLYCGLWYGVLGGVVAWLLITLSMAMLAGPVERLAGLYGSDFVLSSLSPGNTLLLLGLSGVLGLMGSWLAVGRHLSSIEPT